uniref:Uncharacterized protein n=1 Tax=Romanomermis culicivorax TaxID=13658 RepID=A0A915IIT6_ROMCU
MMLAPVQTPNRPPTLATKSSHDWASTSTIISTLCSECSNVWTNCKNLPYIDKACVDERKGKHVLSVIISLSFSRQGNEDVDFHL